MTSRRHETISAGLQRRHLIHDEVAEPLSLSPQRKNCWFVTHVR